MLKTPSIAKEYEQMDATSRSDGWSHEEYLVAVLQRQVAGRQASGNRIRIGGAHSPAMQALEDFTADHQPLPSTP